eukprot:UN05513
MIRILLPIVFPLSFFYPNQSSRYAQFSLFILFVDPLVYFSVFRTATHD